MGRSGMVHTGVRLKEINYFKISEQSDVLFFFPDPSLTPKKLLSSTELCSWHCLVTMVIILLFTWHLYQRTQVTTFHQQALALEFFLYEVILFLNLLLQLHNYIVTFFVNSFVTSLHKSFYPVFAKNAKIIYLEDFSLFDGLVTKKWMRA